MDDVTTSKESDSRATPEKGKSENKNDADTKGARRELFSSMDPHASNN